ncbi:MAG: ABC transporter permease [Bryobacterales bacterium]|nr:ABC transporter permease [Bryobacterales bacterium]
MKAYLAYIKSTLQLTIRDRLVLFFNYVMPLVFFIAFGEGFGASTSTGAMAQVVTMVLMLGVLGTGFFGGGMRATAEREAGILRRFKVAPITPAPILVGSLFTGWIVFLPTVVFFLVIARLRYGMPVPEHWLSLVVMVSAGVLAFRGIGLIIASVVNSMAESQVVIQLLYLPMLMLSGATIPLNILPDWLQSVAQFLPSTHLYMGMQNILVREQSLAQNWVSLFALVATMLIALLLSVKLFRWEKEDVLKPTAKFWLLGVLAPFVALGMYQVYSKDNLKETQILARQMRRGQTWLIKDARIFTGTGAGRVIERGSVLVKGGRIEAIFEGAAPDAKSLKAETLEASGKTVLPGLIDTSVNLFQPGTGAPDPDGARQTLAMERALGAYLYCGVTAIGTTADPMKIAKELQRRIGAGEMAGAEVILGWTPPQGSRSLVLLDALAGNYDLFKDTLTQQVVKPADLEKLRAWAAARPPRSGAAPQPLPPGPMMTLSGLPGLPHGPAIHREMKLRVAAGAAPKDVLLDATARAAQAIGAAGRLGVIQPGAEATLLIVEGNPLEDITVTERIWNVLFQGERVRRDSLLEEKK